jgi:hypothetical protein
VRLRDEDAPALLASLERLAATLGVSIRYEALAREDERMRIRSGLVRLREKPVLLVESCLSARDKCLVIAEALSAFDLRRVFITPAARMLIDRAARMVP